MFAQSTGCRPPHRPRRPCACAPVDMNTGINRVLIAQQTHKPPLNILHRDIDLLTISKSIPYHQNSMDKMTFGPADSRPRKPIARLGLRR